MIHDIMITVNLCSSIILLPVHGIEKNHQVLPIVILIILIKFHVYKHISINTHDIGNLLESSIED